MLLYEPDRNDRFFLDFFFSRSAFDEHTDARDTLLFYCTQLQSNRCSDRLSHHTVTILHPLWATLDQNSYRLINTDSYRCYMYPLTHVHNNRPNTKLQQSPYLSTLTVTYNRYPEPTSQHPPWTQSCNSQCINTNSYTCIHNLRHNTRPEHKAATVNLSTLTVT